MLPAIILLHVEMQLSPFPCSISRFNKCKRPKNPKSVRRRRISPVLFQAANARLPYLSILLEL
ncbi:unnamed protein product [Rodentolepis nana]|uniref:Uncharacterized protein n=1 Tax=Rodentolepis nana TaxID=102285 RepID=A0A3P7SUE4_RODNA|nr:unnamed protein product [Rodentolepis nana]